MKHHELKIKTEYLDEILRGNKTFEIRLNDRNYKVGDMVTLTETLSSSTDTARTFTCKIGYLTDYEQKPGYVVFSLASTVEAIKPVAYRCWSNPKNADGSLSTLRTWFAEKPEGHGNEPLYSAVENEQLLAAFKKLSNEMQELIGGKND